MPVINLTTEERAEARRIAEARLTDRLRRRSPDRPTSRNLTAQIRGASGEIASAKWLRSLGFEVEEGFQTDEDAPDLTVDGRGLEVMTAQIAHRRVTGICVPPNKLWAARQRGVVGYLFVGTGPDPVPYAVEIQALARVCDIDQDNEPRPTRVGPDRPAVLNYVVPAPRLISPEDIGLIVPLRHG